MSDDYKRFKRATFEALDCELSKGGASKETKALILERLKGDNEEVRLLINDTEFYNYVLKNYHINIKTFRIKLQLIEALSSYGLECKNICLLSNTVLRIMLEEISESKGKL